MNSDLSAKSSSMAWIEIFQPVLDQCIKIGVDVLRKQPVEGGAAEPEHRPSSEQVHGHRSRLIAAIELRLYVGDDGIVDGGAPGVIGQIRCSAVSRLGVRSACRYGRISWLRFPTLTCSENVRKGVSGNSTGCTKGGRLITRPNGWRTVVAISQHITSQTSG